MKLKPWMVAAATAVVIFGGIALTAAFNLWHTESTKEPAKYASGEYAGQANPGDIRGSYTFGNIEKAFAVPAADLARAFVLTEAESANAAAFQVKSLEARIEGVETDSVRWFVALLKGLPYTPEEGTLLPGPAVELLREKAKLSEADLAAVARLTAPAAGAPAEAAARETPAATPAAASTHTTTESTDRTVKGGTTLQAILDWGVAKADLETVLGGSIAAPGTTIRDFCTQKGIEFSTVRPQVQKLIDAAR